MSTKNINFDDKKKKQKKSLLQKQKAFQIDIDVNKILISKKITIWHKEWA